MSKVDRARVFRSVWIRLAALGDCDGVGGSQYRRAAEAFMRAGAPHPIPWLIAWLSADDRIGPGVVEEVKGA